MNKFTALAPAKINLYLDIMGKRKDGYHEIKTIFQTVSLYDFVEIQAERPSSHSIRFELICNTPSARLHCPADASNIVWKAAERFFQTFNILGSCKIKLTKNIPVQAGLGGGSSDAAAALNALARVFLGKDYTNHKIQSILEKIAVTLGADVPFFLKGGCAFAQGIGEKISILTNPKKFWAIILKPTLGLSTKEVYQWYDEDVQPPTACPPRFIGGSDVQRGRTHFKKALTYHDNLIIMRRFIGLRKPANQWAPFLFNGFEQTVFKKIPELSQWKQKLIVEGAQNACLSGSGSALYGMVRSHQQGETIKNRIKKFRGSIWIVHSV